MTAASDLLPEQQPLEASAELCAFLGLAQDETLRVLSRGSRTLTLERCARSGGIALPWDRDLVLEADMRAFPLADLLSMLHGTGKSGFLVFLHDDHEKSIYLHRGEVVFGTSNQVVDRLGETLLRAGVVTADEFSEAMKAWTQRGRLGKALVERGLLTPQQLWNGVKTQVEEIVRSMFAYTAGKVLFWEGDVQPDNVVRLALPTQRLIAEGLSKRDELLRFMAQLQDQRARLQYTGETAHRELTGNERALIDGLAEETHFPALCQRVGFDPFSGARTVQMLCLLGLINVLQQGQTRKAPAPRPISDEDTVRDCVRTHLQLIGELTAPLVSVDGPDDVAHRVSNVITEAATRHSKLLGGLTVGPGGLLDPEELTRRALRLPRERARSVQRALGELVSYLEFELMNHPRIDDPDIFMDAVESIRAKLEG